MSIEEAAAKRKALQKELAQVTKEIQQEEKTPDAKISEKEGKENAVKGKKPEKDKIEGYEMVEEKKEDTKIVSFRRRHACNNNRSLFYGITCYRMDKEKQVKPNF